VGLKFFGMWSDLEELLGRKVDLVSEGTLLPFAKESADRDKILIYERGV
jgi:predicted nucleotidyltransferase